MAEAKGLPNTKRPKEVVFCRNLSKIGGIIRGGKYATAAADYGAIGAWVDDDGQYRVGAYRHQRTVDERVLRGLAEVRAWWRLWAKKIVTGE